MIRSAWGACVAAGFVLGLAAPARALVRNGGNYDVKTNVGPDAEAGGWFINLGITGARGKMMPDAPTVIEVAYVFGGTPAHGKLEVGDRIVGANGRAFTTPHKFGYGMDKFGYEGPQMDLGGALEESQGAKLKGKLTLDVMRGGEKKRIELTLPTRYGRYAGTYPSDCRKTDIILEELYAYLIKKQRSNGSWTGRPHVNVFAALALLASGRKDHMPAVKRAMQGFAASTSAVISYGGLDCWKYGLYGVALAEYYLATGEEWVIEELEEINQWLLKAQFIDHYQKNKGAGGWGHRPRARPEGNGYGPICILTAQAKAAWSLMGQCGIEIDRERHRAAHDFIVKATNNIGYVWYKDGNGGENRYADMGRTGASAVAHAVSPYGGKEYRDFALKNAKCIGTNYNTFPDTHGSPILGMGWTALGAAVDPDSFRNLMDQHVWFFNLSHCPDGTFYYQPNRDGNAQDFGNDPRLCASAVTALIFSIKHKSLRIMGARSGIPGFDQSVLTKVTKPVYRALSNEQYALTHDAIEKLAKRKSLADADRQVLGQMRDHIHKRIDATVAKIVRLDRAGDPVKAEAAILRALPLFKGIERFDEAVKPIVSSFRRGQKLAELRRGRQYEKLVERAQATGAERDVAALERFGQRYPESAYGRAAADAAQRLRATGGPGDDESQAALRDAYFAKLIKEFERTGKLTEASPAGADGARSRPEAGPSAERKSAGAGEPAAVGAPTEEGKEKFGRLLRERVAEAVASGKKPVFSSARMRSLVRLNAVGDDGTLSVKSLGMPMSMDLAWSTLTPKELKSIALAVLREGNASDHAVAAFYLIAAGDEDKACDHLRAAGTDARVLEAFERK